MKSLSATMSRRAFGYVFNMTLIITFAGAAGMYAFENPNQGFESYGMALWWTAMRVITAGNEFNPLTTEGRGLAFLIALFGYTILGYITATFATFFIGRDAEDKDAPVAGSDEIKELKSDIRALAKSVDEIKKKLK
jgi:voltage-gated potassium channel